MQFSFFAVLLVAAVSAINTAFPDILEYDTFVPRLLYQGFDKQDDIYPSSVSVEVTYKSAVYQLDLQVNRDLFSEDWFLETYDDSGKLIAFTRDTSAYMCHYTGVVAGVEDSEVTMSLCNELGMRGTIKTPFLHIETQHATPMSVKGKKMFHATEHIIYDLRNVLTNGVSFESEEAPLSIDNSTVSAKAVTLPSGKVAYNCRAQIASDSFRMDAYGSTAAESQNTQAVMNQANTRYRNTVWNNGADTLVLSIAGQVQRPAGWAHSATMSTKLQNLARYKGGSFSARANLIGLTHFSYGGTIGLAYLNTMCQASNSCGVNNVGYSTSDNNRGVLIAHEVGHNFSFDHDSAGNGGNGFVMWPSLITGSTRFSSFSVTRFRTNAPRYTCLR